MFCVTAAIYDMGGTMYNGLNFGVYSGRGANFFKKFLWGGEMDTIHLTFYREKNRNIYHLIASPSNYSLTYSNISTITSFCKTCKIGIQFFGIILEQMGKKRHVFKNCIPVQCTRPCDKKHPCIIVCARKQNLCLN